MDSLQAGPPVRRHYLNGNGKPHPIGIRVEATEFCDLAVSGRNLIRCDDASLGMRGLVDMDTGEKFLVEEKKLFSFALSSNGVH